MGKHILVATALALTFAGCATTKTSSTARTSTEQLLISNAVDHALNKVDFSSFAGHAVYLDDKYVDCVDKNYVVASIRHRLLHVGARPVDAPDKADVVVEARAGAVGTTLSDSFVGVPEITLPGMLTLPEVRLLERKEQRGTAKLGLVAYDPKTKAILGDGGTSLAQADDSNWFVVGVGPFQSGTLRDEVTRSTTGRAGMVRDRLPAHVVFSPPAIPQSLPEPAELPGQVQFTSGESAEEEPANSSPFPSPSK